MFSLFKELQDNMVWVITDFVIAITTLFFFLFFFFLSENFHSKRPFLGFDSIVHSIFHSFTLEYARLRVY